MIAFGPVPSRRLGRSLGVNNIPAKICSYSCVYCQLGRTLTMQVERQAFYAPEDIQRLSRAKSRRRGTLASPLTISLSCRTGSRRWTRDSVARSRCYDRWALISPSSAVLR